MQWGHRLKDLDPSEYISHLSTNNATITTISLNGLNTILLFFLIQRILIYVVYVQKDLNKCNLANALVQSGLHFI